MCLSHPSQSCVAIEASLVWAMGGLGQGWAVTDTETRKTKVWQRCEHECECRQVKVVEAVRRHARTGGGLHWPNGTR